MSLEKVAVGAGVTVLTVGGGYGISALFTGGTPSFEVLRKDPSFAQTYNDNDVIGKLYGNYLVAPYGSRGKTNTEDTTKSNNKEWWEWSYKNWKADFDNTQTKGNLSSEFLDDKKVSSGFDVTSKTGSPKALNQVCEDVYKKNKTDITKLDSDANKQKLHDDLWKYCSFLEKRPTTVEEYSKESYGTGNEHGKTHKSKLVSIDDPSNKLFWEIRNEEFFGSKESPFKGDNLVASDDSLFKDLYDSPFESRGTIKDICQKAYSFTTAEKDGKKVKQESVLKFCSLNLSSN
ncbi:hypothetical protein [Candidatus Mycoplasma haematohominis]|uniref:hypothetical protein n=1 Tax=Candidatus Mycoplasma haematohominis TaxID=1494318 RepID=UPI001C0A75E1|nr:hypothetical protein [Candidatus Mycoplasma haemohominis]